MLYVAEMARNSGLLLSTYTPGNPEKGKISRPALFLAKLPTPIN